MFAAHILFKFFHASSTITLADLPTTWGNVIFYYQLRRVGQLLLRLSLVVCNNCAGILEQSMGAWKQVGKGLLHQSPSLRRQAESILWNQLLVSSKV